MTIFNWNLDIIILTLFLSVNLIIGLFYSKNIKTIREYAIGNRNFSTGTLATTIIATYIGGGAFSLTVSKTYSDGLFFTFLNLGEIFAFLSVVYILAPRMSEFLGTLSIAEAMGNMFGKKVRIITAICNIGLATGAVAMQFKVATTIMGYFFGMSGSLAAIISGIVVIIYSARGGIKAVTFTDLIQFFTFGTFIPILALIIWGTINSPEIVLNTLKYSPNFDFKEVFSYSNPRFWNLITLFILFALPACTDPAMFQRAAMARNVNQISRSFLIAGLILAIIYGLMGWIAILLLSIKKDIVPDSIVSYFIDHYAYPGFKGLTLVGIMSMLMSTADSYINSSAILFAHDICQPMKIKWFEKNELLLSQLSAVVIGIFAIIITIFSNNLFDLLILINNFHAPIIVIPLLLAILGFRSSAKSVLIGMFSGVITTLLWDKILFNTNIEGVVPGIFMNLIFLVGSHYLLKQPGGWVGVKDPTPIIAIRNERKRRLKNLLFLIKNFDLLNSCKNNLPKNIFTFTSFGLFIIASTYSSLYTIPEDLRLQYNNIYQFIYHSVLIMATGFLTYPVWPKTFKNETFIAISWNIGIFYLLIFVGSMLVIISEFSQLHLMISILNLIVASLLLRWQITLFMIIVGTFTAIQFFKIYMAKDSLPGNFDNTQFQIIYIILLFSSTLIAFIKPKQLQEIISEISIKNMQKKIKIQQNELINSLKHQVEFFKNLDENCIKVFESINFQIKALNEKLRNIKTIEEIKIISEQLMEATDRLQGGAGYLFEIIYSIQNLVKLNISTVNIDQLIKEVLKGYNNFYQPIDFNINIKTKYQEIDCDKLLIIYGLKDLIDYVISINQKDEEIKISIIIENETLRFPLSFMDYIKKVNGLKFSVIYCIPQIYQKSLNTKFDEAAEIMFTKLQKIITSHYGTSNIEYNNKEIIYSFIIPVKLNEIRPKLC